jgi:hypothetical protein
LILYPGSACETYKMAYNATPTIAALHTVATRLLELPGHTPDAPDSTQRAALRQFLGRLPAIRTRTIDGHTTLAPAWAWARINNTESAQLYPVFPWGMYGLNKPGIATAINTYRYDPDVVRFRHYAGWKQDAIWAARLGLTADAQSLLVQKFQRAPHRFPTFWGPDYDWTPDHNRGGSAMIALQEMLLQTDGDNVLLLPAWPSGWDVHFKLHTPRRGVVECRYAQGQITSIQTNKPLNIIVWNTENSEKQE